MQTVRNPFLGLLVGAAGDTLLPAEYVTGVEWVEKEIVIFAGCHRNCYSSEE